MSQGALRLSENPNTFDLLSNFLNTIVF